MHATSYRYFLGFRPPIHLRRWLCTIADRLGQTVRPERLHLTLCVIAEVGERDPLLTRQVRAVLDGQAMHSCLISLGRVRGGAEGAMMSSLGRQAEIQGFYRALVRLLATGGILPLHRKSGLRAHITLGHDPCRFAPYKLPFEWLPDELVLIESEVGNSRHNPLACWPLMPPRQQSFDLV